MVSLLASLRPMPRCHDATIEPPQNHFFLQFEHNSPRFGHLFVEMHYIWDALRCQSLHFGLLLTTGLSKHNRLGEVTTAINTSRCQHLRQWVWYDVINLFKANFSRPFFPKFPGPYSILPSNRTITSAGSMFQSSCAVLDPAINRHFV